MAQKGITYKNDHFKICHYNYFIKDRYDNIVMSYLRNDPEKV